MTTGTFELTGKATELIRTAPEHHLRAVLISLCAENHTHDRMTKHLEALSEDEQASTSGERRSGEDRGICVQCEVLFSEKSNEIGSCLWHPGKTSPRVASCMCEGDAEVKIRCGCGGS